MSLLIIILLFFISGYMFGHPKGFSDGYLKCHQDMIDFEKEKLLKGRNINNERK